VPTLETPMSPGGSQASAGEGLSPCNIGILVLAIAQSRVVCVRNMWHNQLLALACLAMLACLEIDSPAAV